MVVVGVAGVAADMDGGDGSVLRLEVSNRA
jgi:hypothetical protein